MPLYEARAQALKPRQGAPHRLAHAPCRVTIARMIAVPDDFPSVFEGSAAHERARALGEVRVFTERGADDEAELARRIGSATVAVNIRAHAHFTREGARCLSRS